MNFGTKGCMYNCGDECTGECIKVETKTKMSKEEFIIESQNTLKKYEGKIVNEVLKDIRSDLDDVLNNYLSDNVVMTEDFPIKFENGLGKWEIHKDGRTYVQPKTGRQFIEGNITISPNGSQNE